MDDLTGCRLNDYQLLRQLGRGAMASVYLAEQQSLARRVAVKVLNADLCRDEAYVSRFQHEARSAASLSHPGIVQVYEVGAAEVEGFRRHYIAQEYVPGGSLGREMQRSGTLSPGRVLEVLWQVGAALAVASERGLVHRDIKPDNLMLDRSGGVKVADFGLARLVETSGPRMTQVGVAMGTPLYMSPEQIEGREVDPRSDLYSLGVTAYQLLTGEPPFSGDTPLAVAVQHLNNPPDPVAKRRADTPTALAAVIDRLIAKKPDDRYASPAALLEALVPVAQRGQQEGWVTSTGGLGATVVGGATLAAVWAPRTTDDAAAVGRLAEAMRADSQRHSASRRRLRRWALAGGAGVLLGLALGAVATPRGVIRPRAAEVERFDTVKDQLFHAKTADTPPAWRAVLDYHPEADAYYQRLAQRGLALCFLRRDEAAEAARTLDRLTEDAASGPDLVVAAARVVAYDRMGQADRARNAGATISAASDRELAQLRELAPELWSECQAVRNRLN